VTRTRSKEDRRVVYVSVTSEFIKSSKDRFKEIDKMFEAMMSKATSEELDQILQGLDTLQRVFNSNKE
jgi:DNA-binding MarR family transcriptional regulator